MNLTVGTTVVKMPLPKAHLRFTSPLGVQRQYLIGVLRDFFQIFSDGDHGFIGWLILGIGTIFQVWMFIDAVRRREFIWAVIIFIFSFLSAILYYFIVYRPAGGGNVLTGLEIPGAADRRQIAKLKAEIHHLDKAHHHLQLGDIYLSQGKLSEAEACYRAAYERDPQDEDIRAHLGNCFAARGQAKEALPLLESVCASNPKHDYGSTLMSLAEVQMAARQPDRALATWRQVLSLYSYSRARVQLAEILSQRKEFAEARKNLDEVINEIPFGPKFQRKPEAVWLRRAKTLRRTLPM